MNKIVIFIVILIFPIYLSAQYNRSTNHSEIGVEIQAVSASSHGGTVGGALKYAFVQDSALAFGPTFRLQYNWSKNLYYGTEGEQFTWGGGGFLHYRFLEWFYVGTDVEILKNPFRSQNPDKKWAFTAFVGGGIAKRWKFFVLSAGIMYDLVDGLNGTYDKNGNPHNPSPMSNSYFLKIKNPKKPNYGKYIPLIYRITLFFSIN